MPQSSLALTRSSSGQPGPPGRVSPGREGGSRLGGSSILLAVILTAQLMVVLDATIVNVALPHIQGSLRFSPSTLSWVLNAYILTFGGFLLLGARAGDLFGRRRVFLLGIAIFTLSSLFGGLAVSGWALLAAPRRAGDGCRARCALRTFPPHHCFFRGSSAGPRHRAVHHHVRRWRRHWPCGRRPPHRAGVMALGHVRQRSYRTGRVAHRSRRPRGDGTSSTATST